ncbi:uncharacterized protein LOC131622375 [Vicia villosa]|uniref:uncharacterized protein LOC131622375 n=1 Tax=Vicia villosa TaxID=3911 RepID=UPI00273C8ED1|nr:uncharacterized protein LOC131622375 [Vicia villosa]
MVLVQLNSNFNHHSKCEKLSITHLSFADDILLFSRGDQVSIELILFTFKQFSESTGIIVNPLKCKLFCGGMDDSTIHRIQTITAFDLGQLPIRYLWAPLSCRKLTINHFMHMVDKIVGRVKHWSSKLLSSAGRIQLVKSVGLAVAQYWMACFPLPKFVLQKINAICRAFIWAGKIGSRKSPVAWVNVCKPIKHGGLNIFNLEKWNKVALLKCLWNICILHWMQMIDTKDNDLQWIKKYTHGKEWKQGLFKAVEAETLYDIWTHRNKAASHNNAYKANFFLFIFVSRFVRAMPSTTIAGRRSGRSEIKKWKK